MEKPKAKHKKIPNAREDFDFIKYEEESIAAFKNDCEDLLLLFEKKQSLSYLDFSSAWTQKSFSLVYSGLIYANEIKSFTETSFNTIKKYITFPRNLYTQLGAFYMLHGMYYKQPFKTWTKVRWTFDEFEVLLGLMNEMYRKKQFDALYIFTRMRIDDAFLYVAVPRPLGIEPKFLKKELQSKDDTFQHTKSKAVLNALAEIINDTKELGASMAQYQDAMKKYTEANPAANLATFDSGVRKNLEKVLEDASIEQQVTESIADKRKKIKDKAVSMKNTTFRSANTAKKREKSSDEECE